MAPAVAETILKWLLLVMGGMAMLAVVPMVMPTDWMEATNDWLGLGAFERSPLMEYLTRSLSALYALLGALLVYIALNLRRYRDLSVVIGWLTILLGLALTVIDVDAGMPASWTWGEGPPTIVVGAAFVWLARRARDG